MVPPHRHRARGLTYPELLVDLGFADAQPGFQAEAAVYSADGVVLGGIAPRRRVLPLVSPVATARWLDDAQPVDLYVEAAANPNVAGD